MRKYLDVYFEASFSHFTIDLDNLACHLILDFSQGKVVNIPNAQVILMKVHNYHVSPNESFDIKLIERIERTCSADRNSLHKPGRRMRGRRLRREWTFET